MLDVLFLPLCKPAVPKLCLVGTQTKAAPSVVPEKFVLKAGEEAALPTSWPWTYPGFHVRCWSGQLGEPPEIRFFQAIELYVVEFNTLLCFGERHRSFPSPHTMLMYISIQFHKHPLQGRTSSKHRLP